MTTPAIVLSIKEAFTLLPAAMNTPAAHVMLHAIGLQESRFQYRRQMVGNPPRPTGPAKGFWQFERGGGCTGVVSHPASRYWMAQVCKARGVTFNATAIWNAIEHDDVLAAATARLLLFTDPRRLPDTTDTKGAWNLYIRTWRPGKPHRSTWDAFHAQAIRVTNRERFVEAA
jgi:hypothetical protein